MTTERDLALIRAAQKRYLDKPETILSAFNATDAGRESKAELHWPNQAQHMKDR